MFVLKDGIHTNAHPILFECLLIGLSSGRILCPAVQF